jgi:hypothetical protein
MTESDKPQKKRGGKRPGAGRRELRRVISGSSSHPLGINPQAAWIVARTREHLNSDDILARRVKTAHSRNKRTAEAYDDYLSKVQRTKLESVELRKALSNDPYLEESDKEDSAAALLKENIEDTQALFGEGKVAKGRGKLSRLSTAKISTQLLKKAYAVVAKEASKEFRRHISSNDVARTCKEWVRFEQDLNRCMDQPKST